MCIAVAKPIGVDIPSDDILTNCFNNNPDGAGFAFNHNNEVVIRKGYMKLKDFLDAFHKYDEKFNFKNRGVLIHTRITTHGGTNPQMCHPFPINSDEGALKKIEYVSPYAVIHNGIISLTSSEATKKKDMSDTAIFVQKYLTKIAKNKNWFNNKANMELVYELIDSKMAVLNGKGKIVMTNGFTEDNGIFYSNSSYKENRYKKLYNWDWYDDYSYDYGYGDYLKSYGYVSDGKGGWIKSSNKKSPKSVNDINEDYVGLMMLQKGETLVYADSTTDEYCEDVIFFVDEDNNVYVSFDGEDAYNTEVITPLEYYGEGMIYSANFEPKEYSPTHFTSVYNIDECWVY
jgi:predicted glutamine amidotransferase